MYYYLLVNVARRKMDEDELNEIALFIADERNHTTERKEIHNGK